jgi:hypothetical protein
MLKHVALAAVLLAPVVAHAEYLAAPQSEVRKQPAQRAAKPARVAVRPPIAPVVPVTPVEVAPVARGLEIDDVLAKVNGVYMTGLQRCYRKSLAVDPLMASKVELSFKVNPEGQVVSAMQGGAMELCLSTLMSYWRFGVALDDTGTPAEASFKISLILR